MERREENGNVGKNDNQREKQIRIEEKNAEGEDGVLYALEVQRRNIIDHPRRVRFYEAIIDSSFLLKGKGYEEMPDVRLFYIEAKDFQKNRVTVWDVEKCRGKTHEWYEDGLHTTYVNAEVDDHSEIARLMKYFKTADPDDMSAGVLSKRIYFLKKTEGGYAKMCEVTDWFWQKGYESGEHAGYINGKRVGERRGERRGVRRGERRGKDRMIFSYISANAGRGCTKEQIVQDLQDYFAMNPDQAKEYIRKYTNRMDD